MAIKEVDRVIIDEQKSSRKSSRRNSGVLMSPAPKRAINVVEENEDTRVRASLTPDGEMRMEVVDKNEGVISDRISSDSDTYGCFLYKRLLSRRGYTPPFHKLFSLHRWNRRKSCDSNKHTNRN